MITLAPALSEDAPFPLYQQLFNYIKKSISGGYIKPGEKLPSLRSISEDLGISITTAKMAYDQLVVEGYIVSRPKSGYFAASLEEVIGGDLGKSDLSPEHMSPLLPFDEEFHNKIHDVELWTDEDSFDFIKWKKCANKIFNEYSHHLLLEGDIQGEVPLRDEIAGYIYQSRGVRASYEQVVIGAGTQQLINLLCILLNKVGIDHASFENPGFIPVRSIFADRSFKLSYVPLDKEGIIVDQLPANIPSVAYVSPSNQFPTGSVMSFGRRQALLNWAYKNKSLIIEDDYNSELRYDSRPVPSLQGLDNKGHVVYLGSFSSTLFPSIKISYMVLPEKFMDLFRQSLGGYVQTCSKAEQLTLALYMNSGFYQTHLRKQRNLNGKKIAAATEGIMLHCTRELQILNNSSGLHMLLQLKDKSRSAAALCAIAPSKGLSLSPISGLEEDLDDSMFLFYYTRIPLKDMEKATKELCELLLC